MTTQELLEAFINAPPDKEYAYWNSLSKSIRILVRRAIGNRETSDLEDFEEDCLLAIWTKISALKNGESTSQINNIKAFIRQSVHNRYCDAIRRKRPKWYNLKLELSEIFSGKAGIDGLALWQNPDGPGRLLGYSSWEGTPASPSVKCREISDNASSFRKKRLKNQEPNELPVYKLATHVLDYCGKPVDIDVMTSCLADLLQAKTEEPLSLDSQPNGDTDSTTPVDWLISPDTNVEDQVVDSSWFAHVIEWFWEEFNQLSIKQRKAILFGMQGDQVMAMAASLGLKEIAESVEISVERLASLINELPMPDADIAEELDIMTRAVPSVRFKAWGRIRRRTQKTSFISEAE